MTKSQIQNSKQTSIIKFQEPNRLTREILIIGYLNLEFVWDFGFGFWNLKF